MFLAFGVAGFAAYAYGALPLGSLVHPDMRANFLAHPSALYMPASMATGVEFAIVYPVIAWLCCGLTCLSRNDSTRSLTTPPNTFKVTTGIFGR